MYRGKVQVKQPDMGRVGGPTEATWVCGSAAQRGLTVVPHFWKTSISIAAAAHMAVAAAHYAFIEFLPARLCESALRKVLVTDELRMVGDAIPLPRRPELGVEFEPQRAGVVQVSAPVVQFQPALPPGSR
jgi:L-alanine-DL-glutamate epimerase-like enolase superfamily enzyme